MSGFTVPEWHERADCGKVAAEDPLMAAAWTSDWHPMKSEAKEVCAACPVRRLCLQDAVKDPTSEGIRGGVEIVSGRIALSEIDSAQKVLGRRIPLTPRFVRDTRHATKRSSL